MGIKYADKFVGLVAKSAYDEGTALSLAIATDLAYNGRTTIEKTARSWGFPDVAFFNIDKGLDINTQCFVMSDANNVVVVFRGSDKISDWLANFQASYDPGPLIKTSAHEGFQDALFPAVISITETLGRVDARNKKIWVTGHSLGGALSSLYAAMLIENGYSIYGLYTFASPRAGTASFANQLNAAVVGPHYRVVNDGDVVPHVPPEPFYSHAGDRIILKTRYKDRKKTSWLDQRVKALKKFIKMIDAKVDIIDNHVLSAKKNSYIPRLIADYRRVS